jgi:replicative DNA helicase
MFIHRDPQMQYEGASTSLLNIIVAKHRNGPTGIIPLRFTPYLTKFEDVAGYQGVAS